MVLEDCYVAGKMRWWRAKTNAVMEDDTGNIEEAPEELQSTITKPAQRRNLDK
jgi:hypothetical protein